jgi:hypothetical protein
MQALPGGVARVLAKLCHSGCNFLDDWLQAVDSVWVEDASQFHSQNQFNFI